MKYCPECGTQVGEEQQFCRGCGNEVAAKREPRRDPRPWILVGAVLFLIGAMAALAGKLMDAKAAAFVGGFFLIISMFSLFVGAYFYDTRNSRRRRQRSRPQVPAQPEFLAAADTTRKLPAVSAADHFPSVTEETTNRLDISATVENRGNE